MLMVKQVVVAAVPCMTFFNNIASHLKFLGTLQLVTIFYYKKYFTATHGFRCFAETTRAVGVGSARVMTTQ